MTTFSNGKDLSEDSKVQIMMGLKFQGVYIGDASIFEHEYFFGKVISSVFEYGFEEFTELLSQNEKEQIEKEILSILEQYQMKPSKNKASYYLSLLDY